LYRLKRTLAKINNCWDKPTSVGLKYVNMNDISERIRYLVNIEANGSADKFGVKTGFSGQTIRNVTETKRNKPSLDLVRNILSTFVYVNPDWLLFGKEPLKRRDNSPDNNISELTPEWLLKRIEELAIENNDLKKEICRLTSSKKNDLQNATAEHDI
jgi:transcriptional regulator with XRE-family HTH domain